MPSAAGLSEITPDLLADLTPAQQAAATHFEGPLLILAGAGSGKTRVITRRIAWLLSQGVRPYQILAITFTNKAAGEMRRRVESVIPTSRVLVCTFHSLGARLLRQYADRIDLDANFTIYDQDDRLKIVKATIAAANIDNVRFSPERLSASISKAKNALLTPDGYEMTASDFFTTTVAGVYHGYEKRMREANAVDFDDLLLMPALAMRHDAELRADLDSRFRFVLIDEYQDTNAAQYEIARRLSIDYPNICVVGDPDQSIYKWRGADIRNILDFERDFPNARVVTLERNYRSTKSILAAADSIIAHNRQRKPKTLYTENPVGEPVHVVTYDTGLDEAEMTVARIKQVHEQTGRPYRDFAVFLRINALSRTLESAFLKHGVPYQIVRGLAFYERKENRDVLAYLRLLVNPRDDLSFERAINEPARGVGDISLRHLKLHAEARRISLLAASADVAQIPAIRGKAANGIRSFHLLMSELRAHRDDPPDDVIRLVLDRSGYRRMLQESKDEDDQDRLANIEELITAAHQFAEEDSSRTIMDFLEQITLASDVDGWDESSDCVSVMTLHAAKGLEFPVVSMLALEQGLLPHERSLPEKDEIEEERRLCYVGMTRAKEELYLSFARMREFRGRSLYTVPSMFLDELPSVGVTHDDQSTTFASTIAREPKFEHAADEFVDPIEKLQSAADQTGLAVGAIVDHASYGRGKVLDLSGFGSMRRVKIRFGRHGEKVFVVEKAKLTVIVDE